MSPHFDTAGFQSRATFLYYLSGKLRAEMCADGHTCECTLVGGLPASVSEVVSVLNEDICPVNYLKNVMKQTRSPVLCITIRMCSPWKLLTNRLTSYNHHSV